MHLALLTPEWCSGGGIRTYSQILARTACRLGHEVTVIATAPEADDVPPASYPGACAPFESRPRVILVPSLGLPAHAVAERVAVAWQRLANLRPLPDVAEAAEFGGIAALAELGIPLTTRLHTPLALILERGGSRVYRDDASRCELEERQVRRSQQVTAPSAWLAGEAARLWRLATVPLVIPNPIVTWHHRVQPPRLVGPPRVLYFGRLEYRKGVITLAAAVRQWLDRGGRPTVTFAGQDTKWCGMQVRALMRDLLGDYATAGDCRFLDPVSGEALNELIDAADLVVLPSLYENFPYACLEAMARGRPVLATTGSGFSEIIDDGRTGFLVPPGDPAALSLALERLTADRGLLASAGALAMTSLERFSADRVVPRLFATYRRKECQLSSRLPPSRSPTRNSDSARSKS